MDYRKILKLVFKHMHLEEGTAYEKDLFYRIDNNDNYSFPTIIDYRLNEKEKEFLKSVINEILKEEFGDVEKIENE